MSGHTVRGTPNRGQARGAIPFNNSPAAGSSIPRPVDIPPAASSSSHAGTETSTNAASSVSASRQKQTKRDEAIRRKLESDLSKKKQTQPGRARNSRKAPPGTVLALKPSPALQIKPATTVAEAAQLMAAKREDCVLVTDDDDRIAGIFTAKDLAFRVVGGGLKANSVTIAEIMTKNPLCARTDTSATDALDLMVRKGFRHLPVMDENQDISGILDITKCFYDAMEKLERAYASSRKLYDALEGVQSELGTSQPQQIIQYVEALRYKMSGPTLESVLNGLPPTTVSVRTSVKEAAQLMKDNHTTAVLVQDQGAITGIFTSKDVVLRVIAPGLDPANCSVVRVMTPHPDFAPMDMTIQAALRKMHDGHYLNLPVMNDGGEIVGMVDVLKLTYATLEQINTMSSGDSEGPAWNKFWLSLDHETESMVSDGGGSHHPTHLTSSRMTSEQLAARDGGAHGHSSHGHGHGHSHSHELSRQRVDSVAPGDSASHAGLDSPPRSALAPATPELPPSEVPFPFKFKAPSGRVHRLQVTAAQGIAVLIDNVAAKLGAAEAESIGGVPTVVDGRIVTVAAGGDGAGAGAGGGGFALSYIDDEGDTVSITADQDLLEAILLARQGRREKVDLFVHDPASPPVAPQPQYLSVAATPASSSDPASGGLRDRRHRSRHGRSAATSSSDDEEQNESDADQSDDDEGRARLHARHARRPRGLGGFAGTGFGAGLPDEPLIAGVPNDLLLPGAIVSLAVVILGVFTISRLSR
ncbi:cbs and pb1 domain containing protein [Niveomyces insectorum RCEF 264]|uniref:Cbs and pb1 domain containing protein n=1 Tax=Niveomyces insectorum RCEF 264 TaxID=1081102 RepID=A0A167XPV5_9HYPO|nr:cbs and pb1 domain containing protein [Niveomyces insectorum RCEF 264]